MSSKLNPYLSFQDSARDAMQYYQSVFGGELNITTFADFGQSGGPEANLVMHAALESPSGYTLYASDTPPGMEFHPGSQITVSLSGDDGDELRGYWDKLSADGNRTGGGFHVVVTMPLERQAWGDEFGMCADRFGINWMVNISQPQQ